MVPEDNTFNELEQYHFLRMVDYFIAAEKREISELQMTGGNREFLPGCEERLRVFESIREKVREALHF